MSSESSKKKGVIPTGSADHKEQTPEQRVSPEGTRPSPEEMPSTEIVRIFLRSRIKDLGLEELLEEGPLTVEMIIEEGVKAMEGEGKLEISLEEIRIRTQKRIIVCTREGVKIMDPSQEKTESEKHIDAKSMGQVSIDKKSRMSCLSLVKSAGLKKPAIYGIGANTAKEYPHAPPVVICDPENTPKGYIRIEETMDKNGRYHIGGEYQELFMNASDVRGDETPRNAEDNKHAKIIARANAYVTENGAVVFHPQGTEYDPELIGQLFSRK